MKNLASKAYDLVLIAYAHVDILLNRFLDFIQKHRK